MMPTHPTCFSKFAIGLLCLGSLLANGRLLVASLPVSVVDVQGKSHAGTLTGLSPAEIAISIDGKPQNFTAKDVLELRFDHKRLKPHLWGAVIFLANGDRLAANPETIDDTLALARWQAFPSWKSVQVPLETIAGFILEVPEISAGRSRALGTVLDRRQNTDLADLKNGDQAGGEFLGLTEKALRLNGPVGETAIPRDSIRLVTMSRELLSLPAVKGPRMLLSLTDGSLLTATGVTLEAGNRLIAKAAFGADLDLPLSAVISIRVLGGRAVYLSDLKPARYEHKPFLAGAWELKSDRNVLGEPLRLDGREYPKGLGMHSQSAVSYDLNGEYQTFRGTVGLDDAAEIRRKRGVRGRNRWQGSLPQQTPNRQRPGNGIARDSPRRSQTLDVAGRLRRVRRCARLRRLVRCRAHQKVNRSQYPLIGRSLLPPPACIGDRPHRGASRRSIGR